MRVGFVGSGRMGCRWRAISLAPGTNVLVHGRDAEAVERLARDGARSARSPRDVASEVDVLCSCRVSPEHSLDVFLGADGAVAAGTGGLLCMDFATIDPVTSRRIGAGPG